ncbi:hypothetical protein, partial [Deinococcus murrayi]|uniref:hypothetical protein n=1 Tax=Deinococcus murrayi TaxID=68910 RepID=UPI001B7FB07F
KAVQHGHFSFSHPHLEGGSRAGRAFLKLKDVSYHTSTAGKVPGVYAHGLNWPMLPEKGAGARGDSLVPARQVMDEDALVAGAFTRWNAAPKRTMGRW